MPPIADGVWQDWQRPPTPNNARACRRPAFAWLWCSPYGGCAQSDGAHVQQNGG
ncbi:MAG: hypothetical protein IPM39_25450 [Chloroflexi bacterium]|nr:hypothetical protein [Chloroflexota bacterium]